MLADNMTHGRRDDFIHRTLAVIGLVMLAAFLASIAVIAADVLLVFFGGILFAVFLRGLGDLLSRHTSLPERLAVVLVIVTFALLLGLAGWFLAAEISTQLERLGANLTE